LAKLKKQASRLANLKIHLIFLINVCFRTVSLPKAQLLEFKRESTPSPIPSPKLASINHKSPTSAKVKRPSQTPKAKKDGEKAKKEDEKMAVEDAAEEPAVDDRKRKADHPSRTVAGEHIFQKRFDANSATAKNKSSSNNNNSAGPTSEGDEEEGLDGSKTKRTKREADIHATIFSSSSFENFDLEPRLLKALTGTQSTFCIIFKLSISDSLDSGFHTPTMVQNSAIPILLQGKDVLIKVTLI
jgi:hypothetical protein